MHPSSSPTPTVADYRHAAGRPLSPRPRAPRPLDPAAQREAARSAPPRDAPRSPAPHARAGRGGRARPRRPLARVLRRAEPRTPPLLGHRVLGAAHLPHRRVGIAPSFRALVSTPIIPLSHPSRTPTPAQCEARWTNTDSSAIVGGGVEDAYRNRGHKHKHKHDAVEWASE